MNRLSTLSPEERAAGVVAASAGNHGQAVAWAAREVGAHARIFMPQDAPMAKVDATRSYGAEVELAGQTIEDALETARSYVADRGATFVHPFEDPRVIAGQGTIGLELVDQVPTSERCSSRSAAAASRRGSRWRSGPCGLRSGSSACRRPARCRAGLALRSPTASR